MLQEFSGQLIVLPVVVKLRLAKCINLEEGKYDKPSLESQAVAFRNVFCRAARNKEKQPHFNSSHHKLLNSHTAVMNYFKFNFKARFSRNFMKNQGLKL